ncbi:thioredoxin [Medusavirus stheno T3]|uniref:Thioredoxin n=1 Tax=Medusavirus stheno T3 TaxID=3069717 RepID=A0A7S8BEP0_9VIRU|nr:thioredoxin [Acanthamoeba castellanii medusavirus]QPB44512.1 thioredoxin [Medusavirus stheno T3]
MSSWDLTPYDKKLIIGFVILVVVVVGGCMLMNATASPAPAGCPSKGCGPRSPSLASAKSHHEQNMIAQAQGFRSVSFIDGDKLAEVESGKEQAVVFYYSTQCGFCHEALPEFLKASNAPGAAKPKLHLYAVEASNAKTDNPLVKVFPTVILYGLPGAQKPEAVVGAKQASDYAKLFDRY